MTIEQLRTVHRAQPFSPFTVHLADGRKISVPHNELVALSPTGRTFTVYDAAGVAHILDLLLVTELEVPPAGPTTRAKRNGSRTR